MYHDGINYSHYYLYQNTSNMRPILYSFRWTGGRRGAVGLRNDISSRGSLGQRYRYLDPLRRRGAQKKKSKG